MINLTYELEYANRTAESAHLKAAAIADPEVQAVIRRAPDAGALWSTVSGKRVHINLTADLGLVPEIADVATLCDGEHYVIRETQVLLDTPTVRVTLSIEAKAKLTRDERKLLRDLGKLKVQRKTNTYLAC